MSCVAALCGACGSELEALPLGSPPGPPDKGCEWATACRKCSNDGFVQREKTAPKLDIVPDAQVISQGAVQLLEDWLTRAKAGELQELLLMGVDHEDDPVWASTGTLSVPRRIGLLEVTKHHYLHHLASDVDDEE